MPLIATTVNQYNFHREMLEQANPFTLVVDEAAEVLEPFIYASMPSTLKQVVFVGDHQQLQPRLQVNKLKTFGFGHSPMSRLDYLQIPKVVLRFQNRMLPDIAELVGDIYGPELMNGEVAENLRPIPGLMKNVFWWETRGIETPGSRYTNKDEMSAVIELVAIFFKLGVDPTQIAIVSTYRQQLS